MATTEEFKNGGSTSYSFSIEYIKASDIKVKIDGAAQTYTTNASPSSGQYKVVSTTVTLGAAAAAGTGNVHIYRETDLDTAGATFVAGSSIRAADLNACHDLVRLASQEQNQVITNEDIRDETITSTKIKNGTIVDADISATAEIAVNKLAQGGSNRQVLQTNGTNVEWTSNVDLPGTLDVSGAADFDGNVTVDGNQTVGGTLGVTGATTLSSLNTSGNTAVSGNLTVGGTFDVTGVSSYTGQQTVPGGALVKNIRVGLDAVNEVSTSSGNLVLDSNAGTVEVTDNLSVGGNITVTGTVDGRDVNADGGVLDGIVGGSLDSRYYTETELLTGGAIDGRYYTETELNAGQLDNRYYTEAELNGGQLNDQYFQESELTGGALDGRYYTETELDAGQLDNRYYTETELNAGQLDNRYYTETESEALFLRQDSSETIASGVTWSGTDSKVATTAAIDARIIDIVDDVGGFVPIANETSFPNANPDVNNGTGTLVSIKALSSNLVSNGSGVATIANGTVGNSTVTINGLANSTTYLATFGMIVETTSTLNTYTFHRYVPKATEVNVVASNITNINACGNNLTNINDYADTYQISTTAPTARADSSSLQIGDLWFDSSSNKVMMVRDGSAGDGYSAITPNQATITNINTVAGHITFSEDLGSISDAVSTGSGNDINTVGTNIAAVNTVAADLNEATSEIDTVATNIANVNTVGNAIANVNAVAGNNTNITAVNNNATNINAVAGNATNINAVAADATDIGAVAGKATEIGRLGTADAVADLNTLGTAAIVSDLDTLADISANITTVAGISSNVTTVAGNNSNVTTVAGNNANITAVAGNATNINAVKNNATNINTVAGINANVTTVAGISSDVTAVAGNNSNITAVAGNATNINAVAADASDIGAVAGKATEIGRLGTTDAVADLALLGTSDAVADMNTLGTTSNVNNMNTLAGIASNVTTVAGIASNVTTVAGNNSNVTTVANNDSNITSVAGNASNINSAVSNASNINAAVSNASNINSAVSNATNINTVASNITNVNNFANRYRIASSAPSSNNDEGDLYFDTTSDELRVYNGSAWQGGVTATGNLAGLGNNSFTGNQTVAGNVQINNGNFDITSSFPRINLTDSGNNPDWSIINNNGILGFYDNTNGAYRVNINADGHVDIGHLDVGSGLDVTGNITVSGNVDGRDVAADGTKLDGIEASATADQTGAEIKTAYEAESNTNAFTDALLSKLNGIEAGATADQTVAQIIAAIAGQTIAPNAITTTNLTLDFGTL